MCLLAAEIAARVGELARAREATPDPWGAVYEFCPARHHCLKPNAHYRHTGYEFDYEWDNNSLGMRDREHGMRRDPGTLRMLFLGDSFVQGHGVRLEDTMVARLEARMPSVEIFNAGVFGYSPLLEYLYLREIIDRVTPDVVLVGVFTGNDVGEDHFYADKSHADRGGEPGAFDDREWPWSATLEALERDGSAAVPEGGAFAALHHLAARSRALGLLVRRPPPPGYPERRAQEFAFVRAHRGDFRYDLGLVNYPVGEESARLAAWDVSRTYLGKMAALCRARGVRMILVVIPPVERLNGETGFDEPYRVLDALGGELSLPVIQLLPEFLGGDADALYYPLDRHWTAAGHALAAETIARELRRRALLPETEAVAARSE